MYHNIPHDQYPTPADPPLFGLGWTKSKGYEEAFDTSISRKE